MEKIKKKTVMDDILGTTSTQAINSKQKGNRNELVAAKWLTEWTGRKFTRVPSSGGLRWAKGQNIYGDVVCTDSDFNFCFTCETKAVDSFGLGPRSRLKEFWRQASEDAVRAGKLPMMLIRKNGMPASTYMVGFPAYMLDIFKGVIVFKNEKFIIVDSRDVLLLKYEAVEGRALQG